MEILPNITEDQTLCFNKIVENFVIPKSQYLICKSKNKFKKQFKFNHRHNILQELRCIRTLTYNLINKKYKIINSGTITLYKCYANNKVVPRIFNTKENMTRVVICTQKIDIEYCYIKNTKINLPLYKSTVFVITDILDANIIEISGVGYINYIVVDYKNNI